MQGGVEKRQRCRNVFLCGGAIETPRLLLLTTGSRNSSGQVGRNLMAHCGLQLWGFFDEPTPPWRGIPGGLISEAMHRPRAGRTDFAGGYLLQSIGVMPVTYASQLARSGQGLSGAALGAHLSRFDHVAGINILGECLPSAQNFGDAGDENDARACRSRACTSAPARTRPRLTAHAEKDDARDLVGGGGAGRVGASSASPTSSAPAGWATTAAARSSMPTAACFDVPGLHVCDNSVFPSALSVNPALTIMALSLRTADRFLARRGT